MLRITIPDMEYYDEINEHFVFVKGQTLQLEHSLISISKWESKWHKSYLSTKDKSIEEVLDYIRCMCMTPNVDSLIFRNLSQDNVQAITEYIEDPMTATWFSDDKKNSTSKEIVTSELIYYWMIAMQIPVEFEKWHINRLMTLIRVCQAKNEPEKKMTKKEILARNAALNAQRRSQHHTKG